jgi:uncharacterized protein (DUF58 family)
VIGVCLECQDELDFGFQGSRRFVDLESAVTVTTHPDQVREDFLATREAYLDNIQRRFASTGIDFTRFNVDQPMDLALRSYLQRRQAA